MSPLVGDLGMVPVAYRQADLALRCIPPNRLDAVSLDDRLMPALLVASPELARRLAHNVLGGVLDLAPVERDLLLKTLRTYIDVHGSVAEAAKSLFCHRNTVFRRIAVIQDLTGLSPADPGDIARIALALEAQELLLTETE
jgi:DNA-binding PucR family transcriptional regulator